MNVLRNVQNKCLILLDFFPAIAIIGVRQCGKTELAKSLRPNWKYVDLENGDDLERIVRDPGFFLSQYSGDLIIDEAQELPELFKYLRGTIDADRKRTGRYILTGSSSPDLLNAISESLAGRLAIVKLDTLKSNEAYQRPLSNFYNIFLEKDYKTTFASLQPQLSTEELQHHWFWGGYPEPVLHPRKEFHASWMQAYFDSYINRDLKQLFPRMDSVRFRRFVRMLAQLSGTIVNRRELAQAVEVSEPTIKDYIDIASGTFIWRSLTSFEHQVKKAIIKMPKGHYCDSGLLHYLIRISSYESLYDHPLVGRSFESFIIEEILKGISALDVVGWTSHYYRTRNKAEIDLILHGPFGIIPIEIKYGIRTPARALVTLRSFVREHQLPFGILINNAQNIEWLNNEVIQIPATYL